MYVGPIISTSETAFNLSAASVMPELERISNSNVKALEISLLSLVIIPPVLSAA